MMHSMGYLTRRALRSGYRTVKRSWDKSQNTGHTDPWGEKRRRQDKWGTAFLALILTLMGAYVAVAIALTIIESKA